MDKPSLENLFEHGGNLDEAMITFGGLQGDWLDLSTGINREPYPVDPLLLPSLNALPTRSQKERLLAAAKQAFQVDVPIVALQGVQSAIQILPRILQRGKVAHFWPSYNEYPKNFRRLGWDIKPVSNLEEFSGADVAILVNPNNPTGHVFSQDEVRDLSSKVGCLIVDESFIDAGDTPSFGPLLDSTQNILLLRSFGKFYGLAGLRLGFAMGSSELVEKLEAELGPWPISPLACEVGAIAMSDKSWKKETQSRLSQDVKQLDNLAQRAGWKTVGGTLLFRLYEVDNAPKVQEELARKHVWTRVFSYSQNWIRVGLPTGESEFSHIEMAFAGLVNPK